MTRITKILGASMLAIAAGGLVAAPALAAGAAPMTKADASKAETPKMHKTATMSRKRVEQVQTALAKSGQTVAIDGVWGPKTTMALKDFQKSHGLTATGHLDHKTLEALPKVG